MRSQLESSALLTLIFAASRALAHPQGRGPPGGGPPLHFGDDYESTVCKPMKDFAPNPVPPCMGIETIETICTPNGTSPLALKAHQDCMCNGSFFAEWPFCLQCLFFHGLRSQRDVFFYKDVLATASSALCDVPTPTAEFKNIFESAKGIAPVPTAGETVSVDQAVGQTAVSLYYTASGSRGPGRITGAATAATATGLLTAPGSVHTAHESNVGDDGVPSQISPSTTGLGPSPENTLPAITPAINTNGTIKRRARSGSFVAVVVAVAASVMI